MTALSRWRIAGLALSATAATFCSTAAMAASATWTAESALARPKIGAIRIAAAVNDAGRAVVVWDDNLGADATHPYGIFQTVASIRLSNGGAWTAARKVSPPDSSNAGAVVDRVSGNVTVFWTTAAGASFAATSRDAGATWSTEAVPGDAGFRILTAPQQQVGPFVGVDAAGNLTVIMVKLRTSTPLTYDVEALTRTPDGTWTAPVLLSGATGVAYGPSRLRVVADGRALLSFGYTTFRRDASGVWGGAQIPTLSGGGQIYTVSIDMDAGGNGYYVFRTRYGGAMLSKSGPGGVWSTPRHVARFDNLGSTIQVAASSAGHATIYGNDFSTGAVRAATTGDNAVTWGPLYSFGVGDSPQVVGSENGLFALGWSPTGVTTNSYAVASGTGISAAAASAWAKKTLAGGFAGGTVAIAGQTSPNAQSVAAWARMTATRSIVGAASGLVAP